MTKTRIQICGVPLILRRAVSVAKQHSAARELRKIALVCPEGAAREIVLKLRDEHRQATESDRALIRDIRDRGGVCPPTGMTREEWANRLPRPLHGKRGGCAPADELAQEMYDRGTIAEPSTDAVLDHLATVHTRARSKPPIPDERDLRREARRLVGERVGRAVRELIKTARREAEATCPAPEKPQKTVR